MEYREVQYTLEEDALGGWQWAVVLGSPLGIKFGRAVTKGAAVIEVWAAIDRVLGSRRFRRVQSEQPAP
jgi:S1-C subfamily serine protease